MENARKAIEVMGRVDEKSRLHLDEPLPIIGPSRVRIIILFPKEDKEIDEKEWLQAAAINPAFEFLKNQAEDMHGDGVKLY